MVESAPRHPGIGAARRRRLTHREPFGRPLLLDQRAELLDRLHEAPPLRPPGDEAGQDGPHCDRVGDEAAALGGVDLPVPGVLLEEVVGMSRIEAAFRAVQGNAAMDIYEEKLSRRNGVPDVVVNYPEIELTRKQRAELVIEWNRAMAVGNDLGGALITDRKATVTPLSLPPREMNYLEGRKWRREEIVNAFGQTMALYTESANRANVEGAIYIGNNTYQTL